MFARFSCFKLLLLRDELLIAGVWFYCVRHLAKVTRERQSGEGHWHMMTGEHPSREGHWHTSQDSDSAVQKGMQSTVEFKV